jgi:malate permease and related proteins
MNIFLFVLLNNILPIFSLILLGYLMNKKFELNIYTLTKLNFYVFVPSFTFVNLYSTEIPMEMIKVLIIAIFVLLTNMFLAFVISKIRNYDKGFKNAFLNSILFYNSGNIGIPLITLVFSSAPFVIDGKTPYLSIALAAQIMVLVVQNITTNTLGFFNASRATTHWKQSTLSVLKLPTLYAIPLAFILKILPFDITKIPLWPALNYASGALVPIALITLGIQLSKTKMNFKNKDVYLSTVIRLLGGPLLALLFIYLLNIDGVIAQVVMISTSVPTAVNTALIAVDYNNHPDFASQVVMTSTLLSSISLVFIIYLARILFPII